LPQEEFSINKINDDEKESFDKEGLWLVFEDITGLGKGVAEELVQKGQKVISVVPGNSFDSSDSSSICINPCEENDYDALINSFVSSSKTPLRGIVHLWNINAAANNEINTETIKEFQMLGCISVMNIAKSLESNGLSPRMWILTRGAQNVDGRVMENGVLQAPAWGIGKVIGYQEMPNLFGGLIDLDPVSNNNEVECIFDEILRIDNEDQVAYRNGERYVLRVVESDRTYSNLPVEFKSNGTYIITGAFGALGVLTAKWMVERGARRLILMGRTEFPSRKDWINIDKDSQLAGRIAFVQELEAMGASVHLACVDVTDANQLSGFINRYKEEGWPPITGVIHTAGVVKDKLLREMDLSTFMQVLEPKLLGSWNLHKAFESEPLDFFVLFSSVSSIINVAMGQANYASGNMFIDALSSYRRAKGLPSLSINWGPWSDVGMASKLNLTDFYEKRGVGSISPRHGMQMMENLMNYDKAQVIVLPAKWQIICTNFPIRYVPAMIAYLGEKESKSDKEKGNENKGGQDLLQSLLECSDDEMNNVLQEQLLGLIAKVFRIDSSKLETNKPLADLRFAKR
jgi:NAD(P)-dependent dehydrogenase (short-subunit alcohol dehydrogenase family)